MPYTAQAPGEDSPAAKFEKAGDRVCCVGFVVAGLLGYGLAYWFLVSAAH